MCQPCYTRWRYDNDRERLIRVARNGNLKSQFGIDLETYEAMFEAQGGQCLVCGGASKSGRRLAVDHDHKTGRVRGLLCSECNTALGQAGDSPERLRALADYLEANSGLEDLAIVCYT